MDKQDICLKQHVLLLFVIKHQDWKQENSLQIHIFLQGYTGRQKYILLSDLRIKLKNKYDELRINC